MRFGIVEITESMQLAPKQQLVFNKIIGRHRVQLQWSKAWFHTFPDYELSIYRGKKKLFSSSHSDQTGKQIANLIIKLNKVKTVFEARKALEQK